jgi:hypothetical protein
MSEVEFRSAEDPRDTIQLEPDASGRLEVRAFSGYDSVSIFLHDQDVRRLRDWLTAYLERESV